MFFFVFYFAESPIYLRRFGFGMRRQGQVQVWFQCFLEMVKKFVCFFYLFLYKSNNVSISLSIHENSHIHLNLSSLTLLRD